jgi:hypothetical protein
MRLPGRKRESERLFDAVADSLAAVREGAHRDVVVKAALAAGGVAALTAGSAAISSFRRRMESQE